jgi:hypothetical protein
MTREEIKKEARVYAEGWGEGESSAELSAFEQGAIWAYNRAIEDVIKRLDFDDDGISCDSFSREYLETLKIQ